MEENRKIRKVIMSKPTLEGAGVRLKRTFALREVPMFGPSPLQDGSPILLQPKPFHFPLCRLTSKNG